MKIYLTDGFVKVLYLYTIYIFSSYTIHDFQYQCITKRTNLIEV